MRQGISRHEVPCPLRPDNPRDGHEVADPVLPIIPRDPPMPDRWSWGNEMPPAPSRALHLENPGLCVEMAINHHRIAAGLHWGLWDHQRLYDLAYVRQAEDRARLGGRLPTDPPEPTEGDEGQDTTPRDRYWDRGVTMRSVIESAMYDGLGRPISPFGDEGLYNTPIEGFCRLRDIQEIQEAIRHYGPVILAFDWYRAFDEPQLSQTPNVLHTPLAIEIGDADDTPAGRNCVVAYGYEERRLRLRCRTTQGQGYGKRGDIDISYPEIKRQWKSSGIDAWLITVNTKGD